MNMVSYPESPQPIGELYATCPLRDNSRYRTTKKSQLADLAIDVGAHASPTYLPPSWSTHVQPEGKPYFCHTGSITTVTESWVYTPEIASEAQKWIDHITLKVKEKRPELANLELYIRIDDVQDCLYYMVDRQDQTLFWIDGFNTQDIGLPDVASPSHLRTALEKEFWKHTDRFPAHFGGLPEATLLKLLDVFAHVRIDQITSLTPTFTYAPADTEALYDVLKSCRGRTQEPEVVSTIARGWDLVLHNRFYNLYGEETPRIDSALSVYANQGEERDGHSKRFMCFLTFRKSENYRTKMNSIFVDRYVYSHRVYGFVEDRVREWKEQYMPDLFMLLLHVSFFFLDASQTVAGVSAACFGASLVSSYALVQQHDTMLSHRNSACAIDWFSKRADEKYQFQRLAFAFALPSAFFSWGLFFFFGHWLFIGLSRFRMSVAATLFGSLCLGCFGFVSVTAPEILPAFPAYALPRFFRRKHDSDSEV